MVKKNQSAMVGTQKAVCSCRTVRSHALNGTSVKSADD